jgi:ribosomal protein S18 acetylase RimI-like enzyme
MPAFLAEVFADCNSHLGCEADSPFRHYVGRIDGEAVASSSLFLGAGVAGIYNVAVLPRARRSGIGAAMTLRPMQDARAAGYRVSILHASVQGAGVYRGLGFEEHCRIGRYLWPNGHADQATGQ